MCPLKRDCQISGISSVSECELSYLLLYSIGLRTVSLSPPQGVIAYIEG